MIIPNASSALWAFPYGPGHPLIRLQALQHGPVSATTPNAYSSEPEFEELIEFTEWISVL
jgi:hypothetical protein